MPAEGLREIESAIASSPRPVPAALYRDAARLYALAARNAAGSPIEASPTETAGVKSRQQGYLEQALRAAEQATEQGWDPDTLRNDAALSLLRTQGRFRALRPQPAPARHAPNAVLLLDPSSDLPG